MAAPRAADPAAVRKLFTLVNALLSKLCESRFVPSVLFKVFSRILPVATATVRGVQIKAVLPLNEAGVFSQFRRWETRDPEVLDWLDSLEPDTVLFDVGASFGNEALYAALKKGGPRRIVCFDLDLRSTFYLAYNLHINHITKVDPYHAAISSKSGFIRHEQPTNYACVAGQPKYDRVSHRTWSLALDDFIEMTKESPDYLKVDVDGSEDQVIEGMKETLRGKTLKSLLIEVCEQTRGPVVDALEQAGFKILRASKFSGGSDGTATSNIIFVRDAPPR